CRASSGASGRGSRWRAFREPGPAASRRGRKRNRDAQAACPASGSSSLTLLAESTRRVGTAWPADRDKDARLAVKRGACLCWRGGGPRGMNGIITALAAVVAAQQTVPSINYSLPGQTTPAPLTIPADAEVFPFQAASVAGRPSAAARHFLLASAPAIPARGSAFTIRCLLDRANRRVLFCRYPSVPYA